MNLILTHMLVPPVFCFALLYLDRFNLDFTEFMSFTWSIIALKKNKQTRLKVFFAMIKLLNYFYIKVCIRPSVQIETGAGSNEDDLTIKLQDIIHMNNTLQTALERGASMKIIMEQWDYLQMQAAQFINGELSGLPSSTGAVSKPIRGLVQRLKVSFFII